MIRLPSLNGLRFFLAAARAGSFSAAAQHLHLTQGAVSRQIKDLEDDLGEALFLREARGLRLTTAGQLLIQHVEDAFESLETGVEQVHQMRSQGRIELSVNVPQTFGTRWLAPRLGEFTKAHPLITLNVSTEPVQRKQDASRFDCLVMFLDRPWQFGHSQMLRLEEHVAVASPGWFEGGKAPDLASTPRLLLKNGAQDLPVWTDWLLAQGLGHPKAYEHTAKVRFSSLDQAINAAVAGAGIAIVDKAMVVNELRQKRLRLLPQRKTQGPYGYWWVQLTPRRAAAAEQFHRWLTSQS
ncbi:LysR family transcriptional regulator [Hydrogenophaga sp. RWCD_12]|uniref:LysR family transcriptional regulator n=1 Tax=Hydrogenophaga sp. RWCD_12 TaxID=3391190 RepID=UPI0039847078